MSRQTIAYQPALDGTRALAVTVVLLFHGGVSWMTGGYLGVSVFFTLSGYLITSLLLAEHDATGKVAAAAFYTRRARRLLPASVVCLVAVAAMAWAGQFDGVANLRRDTIGALLQVFNWVKLFSGESYADLFSQRQRAKNPLDHYWSLAIEEQFYWVWPLAFVGLLALARRTWRRPVVHVVAGSPRWPRGRTRHRPGVGARRRLLGHARPHQRDPRRRAGGLLVAPAAAVPRACGSRGGRHASGRRSPRSAVLGVACVLFPDQRRARVQRRAAARGRLQRGAHRGPAGAGPGASAARAAPLVYLGKISYGVYLYHWPVFVLIDRTTWAGRWARRCCSSARSRSWSRWCRTTPSSGPSAPPPGCRRAARWSAAVGGTVLAGMVAWVILPSNEKYYGVDEAAAEAVTIATGPVESLVPLTTLPAATSTSVADTAVSVVGTTTLPPVTTTTQLPVPSRPVRIRGRRLHGRGHRCRHRGLGRRQPCLRPGGAGHRRRLRPGDGRLPDHLHGSATWTTSAGRTCTASCPTGSASCSPTW
jgi:peptidoglycan/LPS O-acetylase OafA/YrhL